MKLLLTGATGFIGSHLARLLVSEGCEVYALTRTGSDLRRISDISPSLNIVPCNLFAADRLDEQLEHIRPEMCLHLAWYTEPGKYLKSQANWQLLAASLRLASKLADLGCRRFVGLGTCFEYDTDQGFLSESSVTGPRNLYAASKLSLFLVLEQLANITGMELAWLRLFYLHGPFEDERRLVPSVSLALLRQQVAKVTPGEQIRDFLHVKDVAAAIWAVAQSSLTGPVNIASGQPVSIKQIVEHIGAILNRPELIAVGAIPYGVSDPMFVCANNQRLKENTDWTPGYSLEEGLQHTVAWWQRQMA